VIGRERLPTLFQPHGLLGWVSGPTERDSFSSCQVEDLWRMLAPARRPVKNYSFKQLAVCLEIPNLRYLICSVTQYHWRGGVVDNTQPALISI
jgi:hypothetical protein